MKNWYKTIATAAITFAAAFTLTACGDDSSSANDSQNKESADGFTLIRDFAIKIDTLDGKPYYIRYNPTCYYRDNKFVIETDSTNYLNLFEIENDTLYLRAMGKNESEFEIEDGGYIFTGKNKELFGTWDDNDCYIDYESGEIDCFEEDLNQNVKFTENSIQYIQNLPEGFFTDINASDNMRNILYNILNLNEEDAKTFMDDREKIFKKRKVEVIDRDTYKTQVSIDGQEISIDFTDSQIKDDITEINVVVSFGDKSCKGHSETSITPWKYCSEEFKDKLFIYEDMVDYVSNNDKEFYPCLSDLLQ